MPLYEYRCDDCGTTFESLVRSARLADQQDCTGCGAPRARRLLSVFSAPKASGSDGASMMGGGGCCGGACGNC
jgi:putative FmdB family regulatory protein